MKTLKAAVLYSPHTLRIDEVPIPAINGNEVLVKMRATGICATDVKAYEGSYTDVKYPIILGHEVSGEIIEVGTNVEGTSINDRVVIDPVIPCKKCYFCSRNQPNICRNIIRVGFERNGGYAEFVVVPSDNVKKIPENISFAEGTMVQTLASVVRALMRSNLKDQDTVGISGCGPIGLLVLQAAKSMGAAQIAVSGGGGRPRRLELARSLGADWTIDVSREDPVKKMRELSSGIGMDILFEASGSPTALDQCLGAVRDGGTVVVFGIISRPLKSFEAYSLYARELTMIGSRGSAGSYESAIGLITTGRVKVKPLITHNLDLGELKRGFEMLQAGSGDVIKVIVKP